MRLAHLSDLHFYAFPTLKGVVSKRILGLANLYIKGRIHHFSPEIARLAIASVVEDRPDGVILSGDLTALASPREFELAREALEPILSLFPTVVIPGNHDYYTGEAARTHRIEQYFGEFILTPGAAEGAPVYPTLHFIQEVAVIGMNPNRAGLGSSGRVQPDEIERLEALLRRPDVAGRFKVLVIHYPLFNRLGEETKKYWRRLENRMHLIDLLMREPVGLVLHGHDHLRYLNHLRPEGHPVTYIYNAGSAAFARGFDYPISASYNLYEIDGRALVRVVHKDYRREEFTTTYDGPPSASRLETSDAHGAAY
jgi:3',5'-cyclic AMP phosphodiesterase CpdA